MVALDGVEGGDGRRMSVDRLVDSDSWVGHDGRRFAVAPQSDDGIEGIGFLRVVVIVRDFELVVLEGRVCRLID